MQWSKNQVAALKRKCVVHVLNNSGDPAPRGTSFTGMVFFSGSTAPDFVAATGTLTNVRRALVVADDTVESVDTGADTLTLTAHGYETGDGPFISDEALGSITIGSDFWIIVDGVDDIAIAASLADAYANTRVALTGTETGAVISDKSTTQRGIDGDFSYQATQTETDHDGCTSSVLVDGTGFERADGAGGIEHVVMVSSSDDVGTTELEDGLTRDDAWRLMLRTLVAKFSKSGNDYVFRDIADTKDSHHGTVTSAGRVDADVDDAT